MRHFMDREGLFQKLIFQPEKNGPKVIVDACEKLGKYQNLLTFLFNNKKTQRIMSKIEQEYQDNAENGFASTKVVQQTATTGLKKILKKAKKEKQRK